MKSLPFLALAFSLLLAAPNAAQAQAPAAGATWHTSLPAAKEQARATGRPLLAVFSGSDWCKPCIMLQEEILAKPEFEAFAKDKLVLAHFDFPRSRKNQLSPELTKSNDEAARELNRNGDFPLVIIISPEGKVLGRTEYKPGGPAPFIAWLQPLLAPTK